MTPEWITTAVNRIQMRQTPHRVGCICVDCEMQMSRIILEAYADYVLAAERERERYYRDILQRIANGWDTPQSLAQAALDHEWGNE